MDSISISKSNTEEVTSRIIKDINTYIIEASQKAGEDIKRAVMDSSGDFIDSLVGEVDEEVKMMNAVGELLIEVAKYIQSAATAFADVDSGYNVSKVE